MLQIQHPLSWNNFMNPMSCQVVRSIPTEVGKSVSKGLYDIAQNIKEKLWQYWVDPDRKRDGVEGEEKFRQGWSDSKTITGLDFERPSSWTLHRAIEDGANCKGYLIWTFIDCWSWLNGYRKPLWFRLSWSSKVKNEPSKKSGHWFRKLSQRNGFEEEKATYLPNVDRFSLTSLTRPIFWISWLTNWKETLYTDSAGCFLVKLD